MTALVNKLDAMFYAVSEGKTDPKTGATAATLAGKIISGIGRQLDYAKLRKEKPSIAYLKCH